jgi:hypothetical protein
LCSPPCPEECRSARVGEETNRCKSPSTTKRSTVWQGHCAGLSLCNACPVDQSRLTQHYIVLWTGIASADLFFGHARSIKRRPWSALLRTQKRNQDGILANATKRTSSYVVQSRSHLSSFSSWNSCLVLDPFASRPLRFLPRFVPHALFVRWLVSVINSFASIIWPSPANL